jgi:hypothetical protein
LIKKFGYLYEPIEKFLLNVKENGIYWRMRVIGDHFPEIEDPKKVLTFKRNKKPDRSQIHFFIMQFLEVLSIVCKTAYLLEWFERSIKFKDI